MLPLGVRQEFFRDASLRFAGAFAVRLKFIRSAADIEPGTIHLTNVNFERTTQPSIVENVSGLVLTDVYENGAPMEV